MTYSDIVPTYNSDFTQSPNIDATISAETFVHVLDVCDNTLAPDTAKVEYFVQWAIDASDVFDFSGGDLSGSGGTEHWPTRMKKSVRGMLTDVSGDNETLFTALADRAGQNITTTHATSVYADICGNPNLPPFRNQKVYIYSSISTTTNVSGNFDTFDEGLYFDVDISNWKVTVANTFRRDNVNEISGSDVSINKVRELIKLETGESIGDGKFVIEFGFEIPLETDPDRSLDTTNSTLLQEHYEYCHGLYENKKNSNNLLNSEDFKDRVYHLGTQQVTHVFNIHQGRNSSQTLVLQEGDPKISKVHFLLKIAMTNDQIDANALP